MPILSEKLSNVVIDVVKPRTIDKGKQTIGIIRYDIIVHE